MSIKDDEAGRERQEAQAAERRRKEAEVRPDSLHRAVDFLLRQQALNNPDTVREARHHIETLDSELSEGANPDSADPAADPLANPDDTQGPAADEAAAPDTAAMLRTSRRFQRG